MWRRVFWGCGGRCLKRSKCRELSWSVVLVTSCFILIVSSFLCVSCSFVSCPCFPPFLSREFHLCLVVGPAPDCSLLGSALHLLPLSAYVCVRSSSHLHRLSQLCLELSVEVSSLGFVCLWTVRTLSVEFFCGKKIAFFFFPSTLHFRLPCHLSMKDVLRSKWMTDVLVNYVFHCCSIFSVWLP